MNDVAIRRLRRALSAGVPGAGGSPSLLRATWAGCTLSLDTDGTIVGAGPATREVLGWSPEDLVGSHVSVLTPRLSGDLDDAHLAALLAEAQSSALVDGVRRDGSTFTASVSMATERTASGEVSGMTAVLEDVTAARTLRRSRSLVRRSADAVAVVGADLDVRYATTAITELLGYDEGEEVPWTADQLLHPADRGAVTEAVGRLLEDPARVEQLVARVRHRHGRWVWLEGAVSNCLSDPEVRGLVAVLRDVTDEVRTQDAQRLSGALHQAMVETAEEGIVVAGEDGTTRYANPAMARVLGVPSEELYGADPLALLGLVDVHAAAAGRRGVWREEVGYAHPTDGDRTLAVTWSPLGRDEAATGLGSLVMVADVTESRRTERALRRRALYDPLTGLPNRYLVRDRLEMAAARQARSGGGTAVLLLDLDRFKPVNDTLGHAAGDELLRQVAGRLASAVRATDTVGRHGGDEFVIICEDLDEAAVASVAARVHAALRAPFGLERGEVEISASIGIAVSPPYEVDELVERADAAMYAAKRDGGGSVVARP